MSAGVAIPGELLARGAGGLALALGLGAGVRVEPRAGVLVPCPWCRADLPACGIRIVHRDVVARCYACAASGDIYALLAAHLGLDCVRDADELVALVGAAACGGVAGRRGRLP